MYWCFTLFSLCFLSRVNIYSLHMRHKFGFHLILSWVCRPLTFARIAQPITARVRLHQVCSGWCNKFQMSTPRYLTVHYLKPPCQKFQKYANGVVFSRKEGPDAGSPPGRSKKTNSNFKSSASRHSTKTDSTGRKKIQKFRNEKNRHTTGRDSRDRSDKHRQFDIWQ